MQELFRLKQSIIQTELVKSSVLKSTLLCVLIASPHFAVFGQSKTPISPPLLTILCTVQDGGLPHIGCQKKCCNNLSPEGKNSLLVTALAIHQPDLKSTVLFEATPDIIEQWSVLKQPPSAIFLTHAHMGHYAGLMHLGREALGAKNIPVFALPKMRAFLKENAPWSQLISLKNISLMKLEAGLKTSLGALEITPILVPHRDEFSETVAYRIKGPNKTVLFLPDIDKWNRWEKDLAVVLQSVDYAFIDATFFDEAEINYRPIDEIPHPLVTETVALIKPHSDSLKNKIYFIHMNHTNPMLDETSDATKWVLKQGFHIAREGQTFEL